MTNSKNSTQNKKFHKIL